MKTISITAYNRPDLLKNTLASLSNCDLTGYERIIAQVEPDKSRDNVAILKEFTLLPVEIRVNKLKLGVRKNPFELLEYVFGSGSAFNVYLEDDIELSPDAFEYINFCYDNIRERNKTLCYCLYNYESNKMVKMDITTSHEFVAIAFGLTQDQWTTYFKPFWFDENMRKKMQIDENGNGGWDWCIRAVIKKYGLSTVVPALSRVKHMGIKGVHCHEACYEEKFANHPVAIKKAKKFIFKD